MKAPSKLIVFPDAKHWGSKPQDSRFWFSQVHEWLARYLQPAGSRSARSSGAQ
jgi:dipeptidyl aminopeptidase/acylaminoacyl peptidase